MFFYQVFSPHQFRRKVTDPPPTLPAAFLRLAVICYEIGHVTIRTVLRLITSTSVMIDLISFIASATTTATTPASPLITGSVAIGQTIWVDVEGFPIDPPFTSSMILAIILMCRLESSTNGGCIVELDLISRLVVDAACFPDKTPEPMTSLRCHVGTVATSQGLPVFWGSRLQDWFWSLYGITKILYRLSFFYFFPLKI